jgi:hypothetical protein
MRPNKVFTLEGEYPFMNTHASLDNTIHTHRSLFESRAAYSTSTSVETFLGLAINASFFITDFTALASVFDQYRLVLIELWLTPRQAVEVTTDSGLTTSVVDYDDAASITVAQANDYGNALIARGDMGHYRCFVPHIATAAYSGTFTSYANMSGQWLDAASGGVYHYGAKFASTVTSAVVVYDLTFRITSQWKNDR